MLTLYDILGVKGNSILKSFFVRGFDDSRANVRIEIEAYDDTFLSAYKKKGEDYIFEQLENKLTDVTVRSKIVDRLGIGEFKGALVTLYSDVKQTEMYFMSNGVNQYDYFK